MNVDAGVEELRRIAGIPAVGVVEMSSSGVRNSAIVGVRRTDRTSPIQPADRFHIGSNTKALTALLASLTVEVGGLNWETAAGDVLGVGDLRQLLAHSSGLGPYTDDIELEQLTIPDAPPAEQRAAFARLILQEPQLVTTGFSSPINWRAFRTKDSSVLTKSTASFRLPIHPTTRTARHTRSAGGLPKEPLDPSANTPAAAEPFTPSPSCKPASTEDWPSFASSARNADISSINALAKSFLAHG